MRGINDMLAEGDMTTDRVPRLETLKRWSWEGEMEATDGCGPVEDDGYCEHGKPSWMLALGLI